MSSQPLNSLVLGSWPMATKKPETGRSRVSSVRVSRSRSAVTAVSPRTSVTAVCVWIRIFGLARTRSIMIVDARNVSLRCRRWTVEAKRVRKRASSIAVSPPPTIATSSLRKKAPSQVAQAETP